KRDEIPTDLLEVASRYLTLFTFAVGIVVFFVAPVWALAWRQEPFPGFLLEPTLVVSNRTGDGWSGVESGLGPTYSITRFGGQAIYDDADYHMAVNRFQVGDEVTVIAILPNGNLELFPGVVLSQISSADFFQLFWLPYLIGLVYLAIGIWIYWARGQERPGRALAFFSGNIAIVTGLLFDVLTSHNGEILWIISLAMLGGALSSLSMRFPVEWAPVDRWPWTLALPYFISLLLAGWMLATLGNYEQPWRYLGARSAAYLYTALSTLVFFAMLIFHLRTSSSSMIRRQARVVLLGSMLAFLPIVIWFLAGIVNIVIPFSSFLFLPGLLLFPISVAVAILRYRLLQIDALVNRAIVYALVTAILAGIFSALIGLSKSIFTATTGVSSDAAIVIITLIVASAIVPVRNRVQGWIDRRWRDLPAGTLSRFGNEVQFFVQMNDVTSLTRRFLKEAVESLHAKGGAIVFFSNAGPQVIGTFGEWRGHALVNVPLTCQGESYGALMLGPRKDNRAYQRYEVDSLAQVAGEVSRAIRIAQALQNLASGADRRLRSGYEPAE
ncbi:MAG: hypothetical protein PVF85_14025, partial [Anaerolineales bacterium]